MMLSSKKGIELTLQTVVVLIILIVVVAVVLFFFSSNYTDNVDTFGNAGKDAITQARNFT